MKRISASIMALLIAVTLFIFAYKPSDHEYLSESPTESQYEVKLIEYNGFDAIYTQVIQKQRQQIESERKAKHQQALEEAHRLYDAKIAGEARQRLEAKRLQSQNRTEQKQISRSNDVDLTQITMTATFYTAQCDGCTGITANGTDITRAITYKGYRVIAADRSIPFGTILRITLKGGTVISGIVADRGGDIKGARLDILVASNSEAYHLGRQQVMVERVGYYGE